MIDPTARETFRELDAKLRAFVARRVRSPSDVDDVVQEVFVRMQAGLSALRDDHRFGPWVYQIARSAVADHYRRAARHPLAAGDGVTDAVVDAPSDPEGEPEVEQRVAHYAARFVSMLPSPYRDALTLIELEGLSQKEAAQRLGLSLSGMKSRVQRGRERLRVALDECCEIALDVRGTVMSCEPRPDGKLPGCHCV